MNSHISKVPSPFCILADSWRPSFSSDAPPVDYKLELWSRGFLLCSNFVHALRAHSIASVPHIWFLPTSAAAEGAVSVSMAIARLGFHSAVSCVMRQALRSFDPTIRTHKSRIPHFHIYVSHVWQVLALSHVAPLPLPRNSSSIRLFACQINT